MKRIIITVSILLLCTISGMSQNEARWIRHSSISPDGKTIAFCYQGDIFTVSAGGGLARQLTTNAAHDTEPMWTADSRSIVFASFREDSKDLFCMPAEGGKPTRLTRFPGNEHGLCVLGDGTVLFSATIQADAAYGEFPGGPQLYRTDLNGSRPQQVTSMNISAISVNKDGLILYEDYKGVEDALRKHHTSSVTRDVWMYEGASGKGLCIDGEGSFTKMSTQYKGENRNPVFAADGQTYYFLSEESGTYNVWKADVRTPGKAVQVTSFREHPVRNLSISSDDLLLFSFNGDLYTMRDGSSPVKTDIRVIKDQNERDEYRKLTLSASAVSPSPDGKDVAIVSRGDVYVTAAEYNVVRRITDTPEYERGVSFSEDGRSLYYASERNGHWGIYRTSLSDKDDKSFVYTYKYKEEAVTDASQTCQYPSVSPDGKWLAFLRDRNEVVVRNIKSGAEKSLLKGVNYSYSDGDLNFAWSPDSRYILSDYMIDGGWNNSDIALIDIESGEITNLTESGYSDGGFKWALGGKAMTWTSDRAGFRSHGSWGSEKDIYIMFFDSKAYHDFRNSDDDSAIEKILSKEPEKKLEKEEKKDSIKAEKNKVEKLVLDLENRHDRVIRLTPSSGRMGDYVLSGDGKKLYYTTRLEKGSDLCCLDTKKGDIKVVRKGFSGRFIPSKDGKSAYILSTGVSKMDLSSGTSKVITFAGEFQYKPAAERAYIFEHAWKQVLDKFYDPDIHGLDWKALHDNYAQFLPYIDNNYDFQELLSELLGELNASHTGARYRPSTGLSFGRLGLIYDWSYNGDGLLIKEVLKGSPVAEVDPEVKAGDVILAIDGKDIKAGEDWFGLFEGKAGRKLLIKVRKGRKEEEIYVKLGTSDAAMLYKRWVEQRENMVRELSGGRVGYVHVKSMDSESFRTVFSKMLGKYRSCEAIIVDTRHNGGGWLHDDLVTLLSGEAYVSFEPRGQYIGSDPYNKWNKPSCVLIGEDNYSDACGFPYVYKSLGIGKLIGAPVPGTMTAVWWETQVDPTIVFGIPQVGVKGIKEGRYIENMQIEPDILVYNDPASILRGEDKQLEAAVKEMLNTINTK